MSRESTRGRPSGRTLEIQRLIGRSLRAIVDQQKLGEKNSLADCDVIQADGGNADGFDYRRIRRAGAGDGAHGGGRDPEGAAADRFRGGNKRGASWTARRCWTWPTIEDSRAEVDMNVVMTGNGKLSRCRPRPEGQPFAGAEFGRTLLALAAAGIRRLTEHQSTLVQTNFRVRAK